MRAIQICKRIRKTISKEKEMYGEIHSVYTRALNIVLENDELITVLSNEKAMSPNSILLNKKINFTDLGLLQGLEIAISEKQIAFNNIKFSIGLTNAKAWDSTPHFSYNKALEADIFNKLKLMENLILKHGKLEGIAPVLFNAGKINDEYKLFGNMYTEMNQYSIFIIHRLLKFLDDVSSNQIDRIHDSAKQIIGFGPGLTPSMDDLISGLMLSLVYLSHHYNLDQNKVMRLNECVAQTALNKTTRVSEEMLKLSSVGETSEANREFLISLLSNSSEREFTNKFMDVVNFGDTSGTDMLCGIYFGSKMLLNEKNKEVYANGSQC